MVAFFRDLSPIVQVLLATGFTWFVTALGAALIFVFKDFNKKTLDAMMGFAAGVMIAASIWSLILPALEIVEASHSKAIAWMPVTVGFLLGGAFLALADKILPHLHVGFPMEQAEGIKTSWHRSILLVLAITLHNIPEGLAIGVAFGALHAGLPSASLAAAISLAIGIGIQNFPEGASVSLPLYREGMSKGRSFFYGQLSGVVEPIAGVLGAVLVIFVQPILPYALAFAAGAMMFVVIEELIPESQLSGNTDIATLGTMLGFVVMMVLDVSLG